MADLTAGDAEPTASVPSELLEDSAEDLYENAPCGYLSTAPDGTIVKVNQTFLDWTGHTREELLGRRRFVDLLTVGGRIYHETHYAPLLRMQGSVREIAVELKRVDGERLPVLLNSVLKRDAAGEPLVTRTTLFNASDRRRYEEELLRQREHAEKTVVLMTALQQVTAELAAGLSVEEIAQVLVRAAVEVLGASGSTLWVFNRERDALRRVAGTDSEDTDTMPVAEGGQVVESAQRGELLVEAGAAPGAGAAPQAAFTVTAPLTGGGQPLGAIRFEFPPDGERLTADQIEVLRTLGRQAGQALERARLHETVVQQGRRSEFLLQASTVLASSTGYAEALERLATVAVPTLADLCFIDVVDESGRLVRMAARHADPAKQPLVDEMKRDYVPVASGPAGLAVSQRRSFSMREMTDEFLRNTTVDERHYEIVKSLEFTSFMSIPLIAGDRVLGSVTLLSAGSGRLFGVDDLEIAEELAEQLGLVVAKAQQYEREQQTSHTLQSSLLPERLPAVPGLRIAVRYLPGTEDVEVGGDFYDVIQLPDGHLAIVVGDVAGHDVTAAATMGRLRSAARALVADVDGPAELIRRLHETWELLDFERMATAVFVFLDPVTRQLRMASAGHPLPLFVHGDEAWFADVEPSPPLGTGFAIDIEDRKADLPPNSTMVLYTDGLVEHRELTVDDGLQRLAAAALDADTLDPNFLCDHILEVVAGDERSDDVALLAITAEG